MRTTKQTAMTRKTVSAPARRLRNGGYLKGRGLDFGSGKGLDAGMLGLEAYDPNYGPFQKPFGPYDTILCTYVLNTVDADTSNEILRSIQSLLSTHGNAFITVRRDRLGPMPGCQRDVRLHLPTIRGGAKHYQIYWVTKDTPGEKDAAGCRIWDY